MSKPYVVSTASYLPEGIIRARAEVTGSTGTVTVVMDPHDGVPFTAAYDVARLTDRRSGAPRGWALTDPTGGTHVLSTLAIVLQWAVRWARTLDR